MTSFATRSEEALRRFLRTAVVVDDNVSSSSTEKVSVLNIPLRGVNTGTSTAIPQSQPQSGSINGTALVEAFLKENILCTVLERRSGPDERENIPVADIFVLDWMFGDEGGKAVACIKKCTIDHPNAVHLICIYTSVSDVLKVSSKLIKDFPDIIKFDSDNIFKINNTYIVILKKKISGNLPVGIAPLKEVREEDLPKELIKIFSELTSGVLSNAVLYALSSIRDNTYVILSRFASFLDPAFLAHRCYSNPCEDTKDHIIPLICSEISSILLQNNIPYYLSKDVLKEWANEHKQYPEYLKIENDYDIKKDRYIEELLDVGCKFKDHKLLMHKCKNAIDRKEKESSLTKFWGSQNAQVADTELAMLMSCEHRYSDNAPIIKSGTIIKRIHNDKYYICIQPPCDCVRIEKEGRSFLFAPLKKVDIKTNVKFDIAFIDKNTNNIVCLQKEKDIYKTEFIDFLPKNGKECIESHKRGNNFYFTSRKLKKNNKGKVQKEEFIFVLQLKEIHALRVIQEYSVNLSRIGLTESDWLRRCGR